MMEGTNISTEAIIDFSAGAVGGTCCAYVGQPLDTIKVKMQTYPDLYRSGIRCATDIFKKKGFLQFYAGSVPAAAANIAETSVLFLCYGQCCKVVSYLAGNNTANMTSFQKACSGSFAAFFASFALCPLELIKCRMQTLDELKGTHKNITPFTIIKDVLKRDGPLGFYHGITTTILREVPGYFFFFGGYEVTKYWLSKNTNELENLGLVKTIIAGGVGGLSIWGTIYPFDIIKSRMQVYSAKGKKVGLMETTRLIVRERGILGFYSGIGPTLFRAFPSCAAVFVGYEYSKEFLTYMTT